MGVGAPQALEGMNARVRGKVVSNSLLVVAAARLVLVGASFLAAALLVAVLTVLLEGRALLLVFFAAWAAALAVRLAGAFWATLVFWDRAIHVDDEVEADPGAATFAKIRAFWSFLQCVDDLRKLSLLPYSGMEMFDHLPCPLSVVGALEAEHELDGLRPVLDALALQLFRAEVFSSHHVGRVVQLLHRALGVQLDLFDLDLSGGQAELPFLLLLRLFDPLHEPLLLELIVELMLVRVLARCVGNHVDFELSARVQHFLHLSDAPQVPHARTPRQRTRFPLSGLLGGLLHRNWTGVVQTLI